MRERELKGGLNMWEKLLCAGAPVSWGSKDWTW